MEKAFFKMTFLALLLFIATCVSFSAVSRADGSVFLPCKSDSDCQAIECASGTARCINNNCECDSTVESILASDCKHDKDCVNGPRYIELVFESVKPEDLILVLIPELTQQNAFVILTAPFNVLRDVVSVLIRPMNVFACHPKKRLPDPHYPLLALAMEDALRSAAECHRDIECSSQPVETSAESILPSAARELSCKTTKDCDPKEKMEW
ncbi:unnamed protein product [Dovyalis caffra]|uniref:Uncharacterized protein n=1 Tax=Dovyalis caffra TaxID=77055 RepID=A0AAV1R221_9ROSI|nr:unnamed protein product [Dovyalis caffra]